jgi:hypothetical protein
MNGQRTYSRAADRPETAADDCDLSAQRVGTLVR